MKTCTIHPAYDMRRHWRRARGYFSLHALVVSAGRAARPDLSRAAGLSDASVARFKTGALTQEGMVEMLVDHIYPSDIAELVGSCTSVPLARTAASSAPHRDLGLSPRRPDAEARANSTGLARLGFKPYSRPRLRRLRRRQPSARQCASYHKRVDNWLDLALLHIRAATDPATSAPGLASDGSGSGRAGCARSRRRAGGRRCVVVGRRAVGGRRAVRR